MSLNTSLKGRLRNTRLPLTNALFPVFEAVVNSIHSIDELKKNDPNYPGKITIKVIRSGQASAFYDIKPEINGFEIIDNGIGFNEDNFKSFKTLDSDFKIDLGGRGIGRLLWLKAFESAKIKSVFQDKGELHERAFYFNIQNDISDEKCNKSVSKVRETSILLKNIHKKYLVYLPKTIETIARNILEHCLWYFIRTGGAPDIVIVDANDSISLQNEFDYLMIDASKKDEFHIQKEKFEITHLKLKSTQQNKHAIKYGAADRVVKEENLIGRIPGLYGYLKENDENFTYICFVTSEFLTENVGQERLNFTIPETIDGIFSETEISFSEIREKTLNKVSEFLEPFLKESKLAGLAKVDYFVDHTAPRYKSIINRIPENEMFVDPNISDRDLDLKLHSHLMTIESELIEEGHNLLIPQTIEDKEDYSKRIEEYLSKASDVKKYDLANYVTHRKVILDLLKTAIAKNESGNYSKEEVLHKLIMPMQTTTDATIFEDSNLWLIDERLAFHNYLSSDKTLSSASITNSNSTKEPDFLALNVYDNPLLVNDSDSLPLASITVIEIKRPMRNDAKAGEEKDPVEQALGYLKRIRSGKVLTKTGRPIPNSENIPGFCYVICDLTTSVIERCGILDLQITSDKMGYFGFHKTYKCYIEVISYDRLLNMAKERNKAFFDKLGLPAN
ncbi:ATP-binding protein [Chryseobacterium cucumeris]|uniref:ATP-binding protein n=1 Tax=Chryseobacterium cucumeris TaxID=1813611 RepID=UPI003D97F619